jgi:GDPmannose 4,6-dehydratase
VAGRALAGVLEELVCSTIRDGNWESMPAALITGVTGQDGSYLAELLLARGYRVVGTVRDIGKLGTSRIKHLVGDLQVETADLLSQEQLQANLKKWRPDEVYNLAARAYGSELFSEPVLTGEVNGLGVARMLEAIRVVNPGIRFFQASSSELFARSKEVPQTETTPFDPQSPYAAAKLYAHCLTNIYRTAHGIFACSGILFNHESPRRGLEFVTRKVTNSAAKIKLGLIDKLKLGNLDSRRDWSYAGDVVHAMWLMLQQTTADDYVIASGETHSVRELCELAFSHLGLNYEDHVVQDVTLMRPTEKSLRVGDPSKAVKMLGWKPTLTFQELVKMMVESDLKAVQEGLA